jgi:hypothetical protein
VRRGPSPQYDVVTRVFNGTSVFVIAQKGISDANDPLRDTPDRYWLNIAIPSPNGETVYGWIISTAVTLEDNQAAYLNNLIMWLDQPSADRVDQQKKVLAVESSFEVSGWVFDGLTRATDNSAGISSITIFEGTNCTSQGGRILATGIPFIPRTDVVDVINGEIGRNFFRANATLDESHVNNGFAIRLENMPSGERFIAVCAQSRATGRVVAWVLPIEVR